MLFQVVEEQEDGTDKVIAEFQNRIDADAYMTHYCSDLPVDDNPYYVMEDRDGYHEANIGR